MVLWVLGLRNGVNCGRRGGLAKNVDAMHRRGWVSLHTYTGCSKNVYTLSVYKYAFFESDSEICDSIYIYIYIYKSKVGDRSRRWPVSWGCKIHRLHLCRWIRLPERVSWIWHETIWCWGSSNAGALRNAGYLFIAIAPRFTLALRGSTW